MRPGCKVFGSDLSTPASVGVGRSGPPHRPAGKSRVNRSIPSEGQEDEEEQGVDLQSIGDSVQSALAFLGNAATQFSAYRRTKILEEYNKDLVSFSEEVEPALRVAAHCYLDSPLQSRPRITWARWRLFER